MAELDQSSAFVVQARSDFAVFGFLINANRQSIPECHPLHYFQMATEKLAKAAILANSQTAELKRSHATFEKLWHAMDRRDVALALGYQRHKSFSIVLRKLSPLVRKVTELHPSIREKGLRGKSGGNANVEYPWLGRIALVETWIPPCQHDFRVLVGAESGDWPLLIQLVRLCLERFHEVFRRSS